MTSTERLTLIALLLLLVAIFGAMDHVYASLEAQIR